MHWKSVLLPTTAFLAAGTLLLRDAVPALAQPPEQGFALNVWFDAAGPVTQSDSAGFTIDRLHAVWPTSSTKLPWDPSDFAADFPRMPVAVGDFIHVSGSLQSDGTVLVAFTYPSDTGEIASRRADGAQPLFVSGVVEALGPETITVAGRSYTVGIAQFFPSAATVFSFQGSGSSGASFADLRVGDAVAFAEEALDVGARRRVIQTVVARLTGDGSTLTGRITSDDASGDDVTLFGMRGRGFAVDHVACFAPSTWPWFPWFGTTEPQRPFDLLTGQLAPGDAVTLYGRFHDGVFFAESMEVLSSADASATRSAPPTRIRAHVHAVGVVTDARRRAFAVGGVTVDLSSAMKGSLRRHPAQLGDRVNVDGRASRHGHIVATALKRR